MSERPPFALETEAENIRRDEEENEPHLLPQNYPFVSREEVKKASHRNPLWSNQLYQVWRRARVRVRVWSLSLDIAHPLNLLIYVE